MNKITVLVLMIFCLKSWAGEPGQEIRPNVIKVAPLPVAIEEPQVVQDVPEPPPVVKPIVEKPEPVIIKKPKPDIVRIETMPAVEPEPVEVVEPIMEKMGAPEPIQEPLDDFPYLGPPTPVHVPPAPPNPLVYTQTFCVMLPYGCDGKPDLRYLKIPPVRIPRR